MSRRALATLGQNRQSNSGTKYGTSTPVVAWSRTRHFETCLRKSIHMGRKRAYEKDSQPTMKEREETKPRRGTKRRLRAFAHKRCCCAAAVLCRCVLCIFVRGETAVRHRQSGTHKASQLLGVTTRSSTPHTHGKLPSPTTHRAGKVPSICLCPCRTSSFAPAGALSRVCITGSRSLHELFRGRRSTCCPNFEAQPAVARCDHAAEAASRLSHVRVCRMYASICAHVSTRGHTA